MKPGPDLGAVEALLEVTLAGGDAFLQEVSVHLLRAGGKRLRPRLVLLGAEFGPGPRADTPVPLAAAVELVHMATLLHDDVVDEATVRRGQPTVSARWDSRTSILAGDYLFASALQLLADRGTPDALRGMAAVIRAMAAGEMRELRARGRPDVTEQDYLDRIEKKTALFIAECPRLGALAAGAGAPRREALHRYGYHLGMAYQVMDDVFDFTADGVTLGKPTGNDLRRGVATLPVIHSLAVPAGDGRARLREILTCGPGGEEDLRVATRILQENGSVTYAVEVAERFIDRARQALGELPAGTARDRLEEIAAFTLARDF